MSKNSCNDRVIHKLINYFTLPLTAVIIFLILSWTPVDQWLTKNIPDYAHRMTAKCLIIFIVIYLVDRWLARSVRSICF